MSDQTTQPLAPDKYYHIFNHANGSDNLFANAGNYRFFLRKYATYINPIADTFSYCLMPNHFHFAVRIKGEKELFQFFAASDLQGFQNLEGLNRKISQQFSNLFNAYAKAYNKQQTRKGSLFIPRFKRKHIDSDRYFRALIHYIHFNPVHHGFVEDLRDWKHSSFDAYFSSKATQLKREEVVSWFGNKENFWAFHQKEIDEQMALELEL